MSYQVSKITKSLGHVLRVKVNAKLAANFPPQQLAVLQGAVLFKP